MQQAQNEASRYCPKWYSKPCGVSFGFGGKMLSFGKKSTGSTSWCHSLLVPNEPEVVPAADAFEGWMNEKRYKDYCTDKMRSSGDDEKGLMWQVLASQFYPDGKRQLAGLLGFDESKILNKAEQFLGSKPGSSLAGPPPDQPPPVAAASPPPVETAPLDLDAANDFFDMQGQQNE